jgi:hypothetical protein
MSPLQPYSCVERVRVSFGGPYMLVDKIEVPQDRLRCSLNIPNTASSRRRPILLGAAILLSSSLAVAGPHTIRSSDAACAALKRAALTYHLSRHSLSGRYFCESAGDASTYFILALRYWPTVEEAVGSNLIGWF